MVQTTLHLYRQGKKRILTQLPTGGGKSLITHQEIVKLAELLGYKTGWAFYKLREIKQQLQEMAKEDLLEA